MNLSFDFFGYFFGGTTGFFLDYCFMYAYLLIPFDNISPNMLFLVVRISPKVTLRYL